MQTLGSGEKVLNLDCSSTDGLLRDVTEAVELRLKAIVGILKLAANDRFELVLGLRRKTCPKSPLTGPVSDKGDRVVSKSERDDDSALWLLWN